MAKLLFAHPTHLQPHPHRQLAQIIQVNRLAPHKNGPTPHLIGSAVRTLPHERALHAAQKNYFHRQIPLPSAPPQVLPLAQLTIKFAAQSFHRIDILTLQRTRELEV